MQYKEKNRIIYDWVSFTSKIHSPLELQLLLGLGSAKWRYIEHGRYFYRKQYVYNGITIYFDGITQYRDGEERNLGVMVEMSGTGCRTYDSEGMGDYDTLFAMLKYYMKDNLMNLTRLDVAYDEREGDLNISEIYDDAEKHNYVSNWRTISTHNSNGARSIIHGSRSGGFLVRIYDKAKQLKYDNIHWIRVELELHRGYALNFINENIREDIGAVFCGVLANNLRYITPNETDNKRTRWEIRSYWEKFLDGADKIKLYSKDEKPYVLSNVVKHIKNQLRPLRVFKTIFGYEYLEKLISSIDLADTKYIPLVTELPKELEKELNFEKKFTDRELKLIDDYTHGKYYEIAQKEREKNKVDKINASLLDLSEMMHKYKIIMNKETGVFDRKIC